MSRGKRMAESEGFDWSRINYKKVAIVVVIIAVIIIGIAFAVYMIGKEKENEQANSNNTNTVQEPPVEEGMPSVYEGYSVLGELLIDKIEYSGYVLDSTESSAMEKGPVKLYGVNANEDGNLCIVGHNYDEIFKRLSELKVDDNFTLIDRSEMGQNYVVKEVTEVEPTDLNSLMPVQGKKQVTLITCIEGSTKRLVVRAEAADIVAEDGSDETSTEDNTNTTNTTSQE